MGEAWCQGSTATPRCLPRPTGCHPPQWWQVWGMCGMRLELSRISVPGRATPGSPLLSQATGQECRRVLFS